MKTVTKILLVAAALLVLAGALLFTAVMAKNNWNFAALSTDDYVTNSYPVPKDIQSISIRTDTENIVFLPSDAKGCRVEITEKKEEPHWVAVEDGTLRIEEPEKEDWSFSLSLPLAEPKIAVYLPKGEYADLFIEESTGKIDIPEDFRFDSISLTASTGDVSCRASAGGAISIKTSTGDICVENLTAEGLRLTVTTGRVEVRSVSCEGTVEVLVSTGKTELVYVSCGSLTSPGSTGDITMKNVTAAGTVSVERSTGDVRFEACDAAELEIETDTGDVKGSLLTEKVFIVRSDTGRIKVPESITGGKCKVTTDTGAIEITVAN